jgi:hypothetical protein
MLRSIRNLEGFAICARDGRIGTVRSFLFDSRSWTIRYLVGRTGTWLSGREVLIAATALHRPDWRSRFFLVDLAKEQVVNAPDIDADAPVSRTREEELHRHYGWVPYWGAVHGPPPMPGAEVEADRGAVAVEEARGDSGLRSTREVRGYRIHATDGLIGRVVDFVVSDEDWVLRYLVIDTGRWWPGRQVLIATEWVGHIGREERQVWLDVSRPTIEGSPPYDPSAPVNREYEAQVYDYYGRPKYWT